jgi:hypothetical protein
MSAIAPVRRFRMWPYWLMLVLIVVVAMAPLGVSAYGTALAEQHDCAVSAGFISECMINGVDKGTELHQLAAAGLYAVFTWPLALLMLVVWLVVLLVHRSRFKRAKGVAA